MVVVELLPFFNELDVLQARIRLMDGYVARHVLTEATITHQGDDKPLYSRLLELPPTVEVHTIDWLDRNRGPYYDLQREGAQRDYLAQVVSLEPDDLVLSCDADELVMPYSLPRIYEETARGPVSLGMRMIYYGDREDRRQWTAAKAFRARDLPKSLTELRLNGARILDNCGWHLSYLGGVARRQQKVEAFMHPENRPGGPAWERIAHGINGPNGECLVPFNQSELPATLRELVASAS